MHTRDINKLKEEQKHTALYILKEREYYHLVEQDSSLSEPDKIAILEAMERGKTEGMDHPWTPWFCSEVQNTLNYVVQKNAHRGEYEFIIDEERGGLVNAEIVR